MTLEPITEPQWRAVVRSRPARSGQGPGGVDKIDLLNLPADLVAEILAIYNHAEQTGHWPEQALVGLVSALAKVEGAAFTTQFRPITVFPLVYRVYSSLRSRQALAFLAGNVPITLAGGMPGRSSVSVWWHIQLEIEHALTNGTPLAGACFDLSKAFNTLPRVPVYAIAIKSGIHKDLVRAWSGAVASVQRRFRVRGSVGPPLVACCGFAEGCGLSVLAMALVDAALRQEVARNATGAALHSFVHDWQTLASTVHGLRQADRVVHNFAKNWDMELDSGKAVAWATAPQDRALLREDGATVVLDARNLGGHCSYSRRCTNFTVTRRIKAMSDMWPKLAVSCAPYTRKLSALMTVAWPRGLHGSEAVSLGEHWLTKLRTRAMEGLGCRRPGANAMVHLSLVSPTACDPGYKLLESSVMACRCWATREALQTLLDEKAVGNWRIRTGPASSLYRRMHQVGISWNPADAAFQDQLGQLDIWQAPIQELHFRLRLAWQDWVAERVRHRPGFQGLDRCDPMSSSKLPPDTRALVHAALNRSGLRITCIILLKQICPCVNGAASVMVACTAFGSVRTHVREQVRARHPSAASVTQPGCLPECQAQHAWPCEPPELRQLWRQLTQVPDTCHIHQPARRTQVLHLFTDGACMLPRIPQLRLASWAVCQAVEVGEAPIILAGGALSGLILSAFSAEMSAVLAAILVVTAWVLLIGFLASCKGSQDPVHKAAMATSGNASMMRSVKPERSSVASLRCRPTKTRLVHRALGKLGCGPITIWLTARQKL